MYLNIPTTLVCKLFVTPSLATLLINHFLCLLLSFPFVAFGASWIIDPNTYFVTYNDMTLLVVYQSVSGHVCVYV